MIIKAIFVIGPSGSGKSTLSKQLKTTYQYLFSQSIDNNKNELYKQMQKTNKIINNHQTKTLLINLDAANFIQQNEQQNYDINISNLITIQDIMQEQNLGPNGALIYSLEFLDKNVEWLINQIQKKVQRQMSGKIQTNNSYINLIFDLPGQIQLYINHSSLKNVIKKIVSLKNFKNNQNNQNISVNVMSCCLEIFDSTFIYQAQQFTSLCMMSLSTMIHLQMPHINILNKIDIMKGRRPPGGILNDYFCLNSLNQLIDSLLYGEVQEEVIINRNAKSKVSEKSKENNISEYKKNLKKLLLSLSKIMDSFGQVSFMPYSTYHSKSFQMIIHILYELENIFGTLQPTLIMYPKFAKTINENIDEMKDFARQKMLTNLQNDLFLQNDQQQQSIEKVMRKIIEQRQKQQKQKQKESK